MPQLILASASPRRVELLQGLEIPFTVLPADVDEVHEDRTCLRELTQTNAILKAAKIAAENPDAVVIGADTLVSVDGIALAKPVDMDDARHMLTMLSGKSHEVCTAVSIQHVAEDRQLNFLETSTVRFKRLTPEAIEQYLSLTSPLDKAGAYGIQDHGELLVESVDGDVDTIIGLPVTRLGRELEAWGFLR